MAEPQAPSSANEPAKAQTASAQTTSTQTTSPKSFDKTVEGERRSFEDGADTLRKAGQTSSETARDMARVSADATRQIAETTRRASQEIGEHWRSSFEPFAAAQMDMNRWFDDMWRFATGFSAVPTLRSSRPFGATFGAASLFGLPAADVREAKDAYTLAVELPGLTRDDIDLSFHAGSIVVCGHKAEEKEGATAAYRISERRFGRFERSFPLPPDVDTARVQAAFRDGVLKVTLPKTAEAAHSGSKIEIKG